MWQCVENIQDIFVLFLLLCVLFAYIDILAEKPAFGGLLCYGAPTTALWPVTGCISITVCLQHVQPTQWDFMHTHCSISAAYTCIMCMFVPLSVCASVIPVLCDS